VAHPLGVALLVWPVASALLLTIRWAGRTLLTHRRKPMQFLLITDEPVQELAAEPRTLANLTEALHASLPPATRRPVQLGAFDGIDLVDDPNLPPGTVHLRPRKGAAPPPSAAELAELTDWITDSNNPEGTS
jgi:hypothetical protein